MEMFAQASRLQLRFTTPQGQLSVEDLWSLPITHANRSRASLESIGRELQRELKEQDDSTSMFGTNTTNKTAQRTRKLLELKFNLVKFIGETLVKESQKREEARVARERSQRIMEIIQQKQEKDLEGKSLEELQSLLSATTANVDSEEEID